MGSKLPFHFLPKHRKGNPRGETELIVRNHAGTYTLVEESPL